MAHNKVNLQFSSWPFYINGHPVSDCVKQPSKVLFLVFAGGNLSCYIREIECRILMFLLISLTPGFELENKGFAIPCLADWPCHRKATKGKMGESHL